MSSLCDYVVQNQTPSLDHPRGLKITNSLCPDKAEQIHIFQYQPDQKKQTDLHYYCNRHGQRRMWQISSAYNYGNPKITWAVVPVDDTPMPMEFWDNSNLNPEDFPYFAELYKQTYGSIPMKRLQGI